MNRVCIQHGNSGVANRTSLQDGTTLIQNGKHGLKLSLSYRKRRALDSANSLASVDEFIILHGSNGYAARTVDLFEKFVVDKRTAIFSSNQICPAASRQPNLNRPATHRLGNSHNGLVLAYLTFLKLGNPDLAHAFSLEEANILIT